VVVEDTVYFGDLGGRIHALDITNNLADAWAPIDAGAAVKAGPVVIDGTLIVASREPEVLFIDAETGETLNRVPIDSGTVRAALFELEGQALAIVATTEGDLFLANPDNRSVVPIAIEGQQ
jgi:outer membrane protein assembly factor BamB